MNLLRQFGELMVQGRRWFASAAFAVIAVLVGAHVIFGNNGWVAYRQKKAEYKELQQEVQRVQDENKRLQQDIKALKSDPKAIEKEAREQLRYAKPGEVIYMLPDQNTQQASTPSQHPQTAQK